LKEEGQKKMHLVNSYKKEIKSFLKWKQLKKWNGYSAYELKRKWNWLVRIYHNIKICKWNVDSIGEVVTHYTAIIKKTIISKSEADLYVFLPYAKVCNKELLKMIGEHICVINEENYNFWRYVFLNHYSELNFDEYEILEERRYACIRCKDNDIFLKFGREKQEMGKKMLRALGITKEYVCFFTRDSLYNEIIRGQEFLQYEPRNGNFENYENSISYLSSKGIQAVRMGKYQRSLNKIKGLIDFTNKYDDFLDLFLLANCKFFVGDLSGIGEIPKLFGKPVLYINAICVSIGSGGELCSEKHMIIWKKFYNSRTKSYLSLKQIVRYEEMFSDDIEKLIQRGIRLENNTSQEILDAVKEVYEKSEGIWEIDEEAELLQKKYFSIIEKYENNRRFFLGGSLMCRTGSRFLKNNPYLVKE